LFYRTTSRLISNRLVDLPTRPEHKLIFVLLIMIVLLLVVLAAYVNYTHLTEERNATIMVDVIVYHEIIS
jgi:hypothetical protein